MLANNYMETRLLAIRGVTKSHPHLTAPRLEMTRYSLEAARAATPASPSFDVQNRMVDFGIDAFWLSHEPWLVPQPFTPEAGEMWSKEDIDEWIDVLAHVVERGVHATRRSCAPRRTTRRSAASAPTDLNDPAQWATTWRAHLRKRGERRAASGRRRVLAVTSLPAARRPRRARHRRHPRPRRGDRPHVRGERRARRRRRSRVGSALRSGWISLDGRRHGRGGRRARRRGHGRAVRPARRRRRERRRRPTLERHSRPRPRTHSTARSR